MATEVVFALDLSTASALIRWLVTMLCPTMAPEVLLQGEGLGAPVLIALECWTQLGFARLRTGRGKVSMSTRCLQGVVWTYFFTFFALFGLDQETVSTGGAGAPDFGRSGRLPY